MKIRFSYFLVVFLFLNGCVSTDQQQSLSGTSQKPKLRTEDYTYDKNIKSVMLFPHTGQNHDMLQPSLIQLRQSNRLVLHFDELVNEVNSFAVKIYNCDAEWNISALPETQYLNDYNEFLITDRVLSFNTRIPYVHYKFAVPPVKISGNFLLVVYRNDNPEDIVISRRFIVYEDRLAIAPEIKFSNVVSKRNDNHQIDFIINYSGIDIINPTNEIKVVLRQNHRWDNIITGLRPLYVKEFEKKLEYVFFSGENNFPGGNEFRMFDFRSTQYSGLNIDKINLQPSPIEVNLLRDRSRATESYGQYEDADGKFFHEHKETGGTEIEPDYSFVKFNLDHPYPADGQVYVVGAFNDFKPTNEHEMIYDEENKRYSRQVLMKQGFYNYQYILISPQGVRDDYYFEGTHSMTQNQYDILVYYRPVGFRTDLLIGYRSLTFPQK